MMMFWLIAALLTVGACLAVMLPFLRGEGAGASANHDIEVYRDQLSELERDTARGMISAGEAEEAKAEISRRILRAADTEISGDRSTTRPAAGRVAATFAVLAVPVLAIGVYASIGSPQMPDQALVARLAANPADNSIEELVARAERHLAENPSDGRGWDVLAPIYMRVGRADEAVIAYQNAIRLNGANAERESGLGEAIIRTSGGMVLADAHAALKRALALDPDDGRARFYQALGMAQDGDIEQATTQWRTIHEDLPSDSPWRAAAIDAIARSSTADAPGPSANEVQAASNMTEDERAAMIEGMVAQLDQRLRDKPADAQGWQRLVRSYVALGRTEDARDALLRGINGLGEGSEHAIVLAAFAAALGIERVAGQ